MRARRAITTVFRGRLARTARSSCVSVVHPSRFASFTSMRATARSAFVSRLRRRRATSTFGSVTNCSTSLVQASRVVKSGSVMRCATNLCARSCHSVCCSKQGCLFEAGRGPQPEWGPLRGGSVTPSATDRSAPQPTSRRRPSAPSVRRQARQKSQAMSASHRLCAEKFRDLVASIISNNPLGDK